MKADLIEEIRNSLSNIWEFDVKGDKDKVQREIAFIRKKLREEELKEEATVGRIIGTPDVISVNGAVYTRVPEKDVFPKPETKDTFQKGKNGDWERRSGESGEEHRQRILKAEGIKPENPNKDLDLNVFMVNHEKLLQIDFYKRLLGKLELIANGDLDLKEYIFNIKLKRLDLIKRLKE